MFDGFWQSAGDGPPGADVAQKPPVESLSREELMALVRMQERRIAEHRKEIERLRRSQHRSATPFSKERPVKNPKKPGRKKCKGPFRRRAHSSPGGDCQKGVSLAQNPGRSRCLRRIRQHRADGDQEWRGFGGFGVPRFIHGAERQAE